jgi:hypothetical protein
MVTFKISDMDNKFEKTVINYTNPTIDDMQEIVNDVCCYRKAMNNYDMITKKPNWFRVIPYDILLNFIISETNFNSLDLLKKVNKFFYNKLSQNRHYFYFLRNDLFLTERQKYTGENILNIIAKSSFSFEQFDKLYYNIKSLEVNLADMKEQLMTVAENVMTEKTEKYGKFTKNSQIYLNNDFKIFQLLKIFSNKINREKQKLVNCLLTYGLQYYMHFLFFNRNRKHLDNNLIQMNEDLYFEETYCSEITDKFPLFFDNLIETDWEYCCINIYNIYETIQKTRDNKYHHDINCHSYRKHTFKSIIMYPITNHDVELTCKNIIDLFQIEDEFIYSKKKRSVIKYIPWKYIFKYINIISVNDEIIRNNISYMKEIYNQSFYIALKITSESKSFPKEFKTSVLEACDSIQKKLQNKI